MGQSVVSLPERLGDGQGLQITHWFWYWDVLGNGNGLVDRDVLRDVLHDDFAGRVVVPPSASVIPSGCQMHDEHQDQGRRSSHG